MQLIRDNRYEIRDTRWRFNFVNSLDQFIYFDHIFDFNVIDYFTRYSYSITTSIAEPSSIVVSWSAMSCIVQAHLAA